MLTLCRVPLASIKSTLETVYTSGAESETQILRNWRYPSIRLGIGFGIVALGFIVTYDKAVIYIRADTVAVGISIVPGQKRKNRIEVMQRK